MKEKHAHSNREIITVQSAHNKLVKNIEARAKNHNMIYTNFQQRLEANKKTIDNVSRQVAETQRQEQCTQVSKNHPSEQNTRIHNKTLTEPDNQRVGDEQQHQEQRTHLRETVALQIVQQQKSPKRTKHRNT